MRLNLYKIMLCIPVAVVALLFLAAVAAYIITGRSFDECFFVVCCGVMWLAGKALGLSYKEICVIGNIYAEALVCLLTALWVTWICVRNFRRQRTLKRGIVMAGGIVYGLMFVGAFILICKHYAMPLNDAFDLCYSELVMLAGKYHTTYNMVNYVIFIGLFLVCVTWNCLLAIIIGSKTRMHKKDWMHYLCSIMKRESSNKGDVTKRKRWVKLAVVTAIMAVMAYGAWYAYCHFVPMLRDITSGSTSPGIVDAEYQFGDINSTHLTAAREHGITPAENRTALQTSSLEKVSSCSAYRVEHLTHSVPYLMPASKDLLNEIGSRFQQAVKEQGFENHRIIVTSVLRTGEDVRRLRKVNGNASANSAHQYATTFDISYTRFERMSLDGKPVSNKQLANILGRVLKELRNEGRCYIKYERNQTCFHITSRL